MANCPNPLTITVLVVLCGLLLATALMARRNRRGRRRLWGRGRFYFSRFQQSELSIAEMRSQAWMMRTVISILVNAAFVSCAVSETLYSVEWSRQAGSSSFDESTSIAADRFGNVYISGSTFGSLAGEKIGVSDAFLLKYDNAGELLWSRQLGTTNGDESFGVAADELGNVYISGYTRGDLAGSNAGARDAFLGKYDGNGALVWTRQLGTIYEDISFAVSTDNEGNVLISGYTDGVLSGPFGFQAFVSKFDNAGNLLWNQQVGTNKIEYSYSVAADSASNVYISGYTEGGLDSPNLGSRDVFVTKLDSTGTLQWSRQLGTDRADESFSLSVDAFDNVYLSGRTNGSLDGPNAGSTDAFVGKYDGEGNLLWVRQIGTDGFDESNGVWADAVGSVYISGYTWGNIGGPNIGEADAFVAKYDSTGDLLWTRQVGTSQSDVGFGIAGVGEGVVYISGRTEGDLGTPHPFGSYDAFLMKLELPEPSTFVLLFLSAVTLVSVRARGVLSARLAKRVNSAV